MKNLITLICLLSITIVVPAKPAQLTATAWERCMLKAEASAKDEGIAGAEIAVINQCGARPLNESHMQNPVKQAPYDVLRSKHWKNSFKRVLGAKYDEFVAASRVSDHDGVKLVDKWMVGEASGAPGHGNSGDSIIFLIESQSKRIYAAASLSGQIFRFGFNQKSQNIPIMLTDWIKGLE
ncbi:hypothetical protein DFR44_1502 [Hydromonas duriensis]|uniref:Uncharacterized protein n=2 Tax=Hydromonas duriensis TaxID=1527608 RepID=A0A4R6XZR8_9BURK|nr:hypothetical protein DFR44_1502 [Hydromonas duriensis]